MIGTSSTIETCFQMLRGLKRSASCHGHFELVQQMVKAGANVNTVDIDYFSPLFYAKYRNFEDIVDFLTPLTNLEIRDIVQQKLESI